MEGREGGNEKRVEKGKSTEKRGRRTRRVELLMSLEQPESGAG